MALAEEGRIEGTREMYEAFGRLEAVARPVVLRGAARAGALPILNDAKIRAPKKTGNYARSLHMEDGEVTAEKASVDLGTNEPQGMALEFGSGLHRTGPLGNMRDESGRFTSSPMAPAKYKIAPLGDYPLAFFWKNHPTELKPNAKTGKFNFRFVMHPGIKAQPHWTPALVGNREAAIEAAGAALEVAIYATLRGGQAA